MTDLEKLVDELLEPLKDGCQIQDLWDIVVSIMKHAEDWVGLTSGADKKEFALEVLEIILDHESIDLPGPDWITKRVVMWLAPSLIDKFVDIAKDKLNFG